LEIKVLDIVDARCNNEVHLMIYLAISEGKSEWRFTEEIEMWFSAEITFICRCDCH